MITGYNGFIERPRRYGFRHGQGAYDARIFEGPTSQLATWLTANAGAGIAGWEVEEQGEHCVVTLTYESGQLSGYGTGNDSTGLVEDLWELEGADEDVSLWQWPALVTVIDGYTSTQLATLRKTIEDAYGGTDPGNLGNATLNKFARWALQGIETFPSSTYVLRHTLVVRRNTTLKATHANIGKIFTYAKLLAATESASLVNQNIIAASDLTTWLWKKMTPDVKPTSRGLWEITQDYVGGVWFDSDLFPNAP
jgi:hypothetical protein